MLYNTKRGFTLLELVITVIIIAVLAAIAVSAYQKAILKSRFNALMPIAKSLANGNEVYYLEHGTYAPSPDVLDVAGRDEYPSGTSVRLHATGGYAYVMASDRLARNNYIVYQKHSENFPNEIHCEALADDDTAEYVCRSAGATRDIGTILKIGRASCRERV